MHPSPRPLLLALLLALPGCPTEPPPRAPEDWGTPEGSESPDPPPPTTGGVKGPTEDAPEISRSRGEKGGVVVLWPRIWPRDDKSPEVHEMATRLQQQLKAIAEKAAPGRPIDVRPEPERVCPRDGCNAATLGAILIHRDKACAAVAFVSGPGTSPGRLLPWAGGIKLASETVPFREPPEEQVSVEDYASCAKLLDRVSDREKAITEYLKGLVP